MGTGCYDLQVKTDFFLHLLTEISDDRSRHDELLEDTSGISQHIDQLVIPVSGLRVNQLACRGLGIFVGLLSGKQIMQIIRNMKERLSLFQIFRMRLLDSHQLIDRVEDCFLNTGSGIKIVEGDGLVDFIVHAVGTMIAISDRIAEDLLVLVQKNKVNAPGIHAHADRDLADLFAFLQSVDHFAEDPVKFPAEFSVLFDHTVFKTVDLLEDHLSVFQMSENMTSAGCADIYCQIICCHLKSSFGVIIK